MALPNFRDALADRAFGPDVRTLPAVAPRGLPSVGFSYVANPNPTGASDLVNALRAFKPDLDKFFGEELKDQRQQQFEQGQIAQGKNQLQFAQAVEQGRISETQNPWFIKGWQEQEGRTSGLEYNIALRTAWAESALRTSTDPKAFTEFTAKFRREYIEKAGYGKDGAASTEWWKGFQDVANRSDATLASEHADAQQREISARVRTNTGSEISAILTRLARDPDSAAAEIAALRDKMQADGLQRSETDRIIAEQVIAQAKVTRNPGILSVLDKITLPNGKPLSSDAKIVSAKADLTAHLQDRARSDIRWGWAQDDRQWTLQQRQRAKEIERREDERYQREKDRWNREDYARNTMSLALAKIGADPANYQSNIKPFLDELLSRGYGDAAAELSRVGQAYLDQRQLVDDRALRGRYTNDIIDSAGDVDGQMRIMRRLNQDLIDGKINKATHGALIEDARRFGEMSTTRYLQDPVVADVLGAVDKIAAKDPGGLFGAAAATAAEMKLQLKRYAVELKSATPGMSNVDLATALNKKLTEILPLINQNTPESPLGVIQRQAREVQGGAPEKSLKDFAQSVHPDAKARLIKAVSEAQDTATVLRLLSDFDAIAKRPGVAQEIINQERQRLTTPTKPGTAPATPNHWRR